MLDSLKITRRTLNNDGTLSISTKTNDSEHGPHRFSMVIDAVTVLELPSGDNKEPAMNDLIKNNIGEQHADWIERKISEQPINDEDIDAMKLNKNIL